MSMPTGSKASRTKQQADDEKHGDGSGATPDRATANNIAQDLETAQSQIKQLQADLRSAHAEMKIHKDAWISEAEKSAAISAQLDSEKHEHAAVKSRLNHLTIMIRKTEAAVYEGLTSHGRFDADGWRDMYQHLVRAIMPVFTQRD